MSKLLNPDQIESRLKKLSVEWAVVGGTQLNRVYKFDDFASALEFTNKLGKLADKLQHHPDIRLSWGKVEVDLTTHSEGGLTAKDFEFASLV